jgi:hypothetical protein
MGKNQNRTVHLCPGTKKNQKKMFGLENITWGRFLGFTAFILLCWYAGVYLLARIKDRNRNPRFFEDDEKDRENGERQFFPISVSSLSFPAEAILYREEDVPLEVTFYEETGLDEGYGIDTFTGKNNPKLSAILPKIQYQQ